MGCDDASRCGRPMGCSGPMGRGNPVGPIVATIKGPCGCRVELMPQERRWAEVSGGDERGQAEVKRGEDEVSVVHAGGGERR